MKKIKKFIKDAKECGIKYAICWLLDLPYCFENAKIQKLRKFSSRCYDFCLETYTNRDSIRIPAEQAQENCTESVPEWDNNATPCGCVIFNDCMECGSYPVCGR